MDGWTTARSVHSDNNWQVNNCRRTKRERNFISPFGSTGRSRPSATAVLVCAAVCLCALYKLVFPLFVESLPHNRQVFIISNERVISSNLSICSAMCEEILVNFSRCCCCPLLSLTSHCVILKYKREMICEAVYVCLR